MKLRIACLVLAMLAGAASPALAAGCSAPSLPAAPAPAPKTNTHGQDEVPADAALLAYVWACTDGRSVTTYPQPAALQVVDGGCQRTLPRVPAATGTRYEDRFMLFWSRGTEAQLRRKPGRLTACFEFRQASLQEDARVRGVSVRGFGRLPNGESRWLLEIGPGPALSLTLGPTPQAGAQRLVFARFASISDAGSGTTAYTASAAGHAIRIKVTPDTCKDERSGSQYPGTVALELDGVAYAGCGVMLSR